MNQELCHIRVNRMGLLRAVVVLGLVSSVLCQEIGWEERLRNNVYCVKWDVKP